MSAPPRPPPPGPPAPPPSASSHHHSPSISAFSSRIDSPIPTPHSLPPPQLSPLSSPSSSPRSSPTSAFTSAPPSSSPICPQCSLPYHDVVSSSYPRVLHCLHTYCTNCCQILAHQGTGKNIICPLCSFETALTDRGILDLQTNHSLIHLMKLKQKQQLLNEKFVCNNCDVEAATWRCQNCDEGCANLCNDCKLQHLQMKALRSHVLIPMKEYQESNLYPRDQIACQKHRNEFLEIYCCDCKMAICLTCAVYEHQHHQRKTIQDGEGIEKREMQQDLLNLHDVYDVYEQETNQIENISKNLSHQNELLKNKTRNIFQELHNLLHERENLLLSDLDALYQLKFSLLANQITGLRHSIMSARASGDYVDSILEHASPLQTILASQQIHQHLSLLSATHLDTMAHSQADLIFESGTLPTITNLVSGLGRFYDESTPIPSLCELSQVSVSVAPNHFWLTVFHLSMRQSNGELLTHWGGIKPTVLVKMYDIQSPIQSERKNKEDVFEVIPHSISFQNGFWKIEVLSSKISGIVVEASIIGEDVQFSPLMATRGPEITLWGEDAGIILKSVPSLSTRLSSDPLPTSLSFLSRSTASHLGNIISAYGPENLRSNSGSLKWKTSKTQNMESLDESVELGLIAPQCLLGHINLINRKAQFYRLYYRPPPAPLSSSAAGTEGGLEEEQPWLPFHIITPATSPSIPEWSEIHPDAKWTIRLTEEECRELGPVSALRLELKSSLAGSSFCMINVFGWDISTSTSAIDTWTQL